MKKRLLIIIVLAFGAACGHAQREGRDTVSHEDWRFRFPSSGWDTANFFWQMGNPDFYGAPARYSYLQFSTMQPVSIYGVAVVSERYGPVFGRNIYFNTIPDAVIDSICRSVDSSDLGLYALLIQQDSGGVFHRVDSVRWHPRDPDRYFRFTCNDGAYTPTVYDTAMPMYEFYFKNPHTVLGNYYLGFRSDYVVANYEPWESWPLQWMWPILTIYSTSADDMWRRSWYVGYSGYMSFWAGSYPNPDTVVELTYAGWFGLCPILAPPDTDAVHTLPVEGLRRDGLWNGRSVFAWDHTPGQLQYQVSYGPASQDPDSHALFFAYQTRCSLPEADSQLDPTVPYVVRCRAQCHHACALHDTLAWSDWSDPVEFYPSIPDTTLAAVRPQNVVFALSPNPASDRVAVLLPDGQAWSGTLVIRDVSGRERLRCKVPGQGLSLPIHDLPAGTYFVTVATDRGCTTQKLMVK